MHPVLQYSFLLCWHWYFQQIGAEDCLCSAVPISQAVEQPRLLLQSEEGRERFPGQEQFCPDVPWWQSWRRQGWRSLPATDNTQAHLSSRVDDYSICACEKPAAEPPFWSQLLFSRYKWPMVKTETFAKTNVWSRSLRTPQSAHMCSDVRGEEQGKTKPFSKTSNSKISFSWATLLFLLWQVCKTISMNLTST